MKKSGVFINTSRGGLVNQEDLVEALQSGQAALIIYLNMIILITIIMIIISMITLIIYNVIYIYINVFLCHSSKL